MSKKMPNLIKDLTYKTINKISDIYSYIYSRLSNKPLIYVIGDSHSAIFNNKRLFIAHHIGPATMHNLNKQNSSTKSNEKLFKIIKNINRQKDIIMLVFGEIDCRIHIYHQYEKQNKKFTIPELIDKTISNYECVLKKIKAAGIKICVYGIPAAGKQENFYKYPYYGTPEMRSYIYKEFNEKLKSFCEKNKYAFINIYSIVSDKDGFLSKEYAADEVHLNDKIVDFVRREINKNFDK